MALIGLASACSSPSAGVMEMSTEMDDTNTPTEDATSNKSPELLPPRATTQHCQPLRTDLKTPSLALHDRIVAPDWSGIAGMILSPESIPRILVVEPTGLIWSTALRDSNIDATVRFWGQLDDSIAQVDAVVAGWIDGYWKLFALGRTHDGRLELQGYAFDGVTITLTETFRTWIAPTQRTRSGLIFDPKRRSLWMWIDDGTPLGIPDELSPAQMLDRVEGKLHRWSVGIDASGTTFIPAGQGLDAAGGQTSIWARGVHRFQGCSLHFDDELPICVVSDRQSESVVVMNEAAQNLGWPQADVLECADETCEREREVDIIDSIPRVSSACPTIGMAGIEYNGERFDTALKRCEGTFLLWSRAEDTPKKAHSAFVGDVETDRIFTSEGQLFAVSSGRFAVSEVVFGVAFARKLSETGCFTGVGWKQPVDDLFAYFVQSPLWSDAARKSRYLSVPPDKVLSFDERGELVAPDGTVVIKNFDLPFTQLPLGTYAPAETRIMVQHQGQWSFATYRWDSDGQDATLLEQGQRATFVIHDEKGARDLVYDFPSPFTCTTCHGTSGTQLLGLSAAQLQADYQSDGQYEAQLPAWRRVGYIEHVPPVVHLLVDPLDEHASLEARARSYLHANCSHCHRPGGWVPPIMDMDLRISTPPIDTKTCGVKLAYPGIWTDAEFRIRPGDSEDSAIWQRMNRRGLGQMPPVGTTEHDGLAHVVQSWIDGLSSADCAARGPG